MDKRLVIVLFLLNRLWAFAQLDMTEYEGNQEYNDQIAQEMEYYKLHPIDLNAIDESMAGTTILFSNDFCEQVISHRDHFGDFIDVLELQQCQLSKSQIEFIQPYVKVNIAGLGGVLPDKTHTIVLTAIRKVSHANDERANSNYVGNRMNTVFRYRGILSDKLRFGYSGEKDIGEAYFGANRLVPFDFNSGYLYVKNAIRRTSLILGDYTCDFGQGLTVGSGMRVGKSAQAIQTSKFSSGIKPYRSITEFNFNRGIALSRVTASSQVHVWFHSKKVDASLADSSENKLFHAFQRTGLHRTTNEIKNKASIRTNRIGFNLKYVLNNLSITYVGVYAQHEGKVIPSSDVYKRFNNQSNTYFKQGIAYTLGFNTGFLFGETTLCSNDAVGMINGFVTGLGKSISLTGVYRKIDPGFISNGSAAFVESTAVNNETGMYLGMTYKPTAKSNVSAYADHHWFPWLRYQNVSSSHGVDYVIRYEQRFSRQLLWHFQMKYESVMSGSQSEYRIKPLTEKKLFKLRFHVNHALSKQLKLQTRFAINQSTVVDDSKTGSMLYQDLQFEPHGKNFKLYLRLASARVEDFKARIYTYENDLAYRFSIPFYSEDQLRSYILLRWNVSNQVDFWFKYILTHKGGGNDLDSVSSPYVSNIHIQLRARL